MLWDLEGDLAIQYLSTWNTCVKLSWDLPRATHSYFLTKLSAGIISAKRDIICRYAGFVKGLMSSPSREVTIMARLVVKDVRTTTAKNIKVLEREAGGLSWGSTTREIRKELFKKVEDIPVTDQWRLPYLTKLLEQRDVMTYNGEGEESEELTRVKELLDSLCIN